MYSFGGKGSLLLALFATCICQKVTDARHGDKQKFAFQGSGDGPWIDGSPDRGLARGSGHGAKTAAVHRYNQSAEVLEGSCGRKIVGGQVAGDHWPWQAQLFVRETGRHLCGGTLIATGFVLTAAHCFDKYREDEVLVRLGSGDRGRLLQPSSGRTHPIACLHVHKRYRAGAGYDYDLALLRLKAAAAEATKVGGMDDRVAPACLPSGRERFGDGANCVVTGWGYTNFRSLLMGQLPSRLMEATVPLLSPRTCRNAYGYSLTRRMVCAGRMSGDRRPDTCKGDSGGPLVCQSAGSTWTLWGVTSWGRNYFCSQSPTDSAPGVYTRVDRFTGWIRKKMTSPHCPAN